MRIDSARTLLEEHPLDASPTLVLSERAQGVSVIQLEADDTFETLLAVLGQQTKPLIIVLPEQGGRGAAFTSAEHFSQLRQQSPAPLRSLVVPSLRIATLGKLAQQQGIPIATTIEQALIQALDTSPALYQDSGALSVRRPRTTGDLNPQFQWPIPLYPVPGGLEGLDNLEAGGYDGGSLSHLLTPQSASPAKGSGTSREYLAVLPSQPAQPTHWRRLKKRQLIVTICVALLVVVVMALLPWLLSTPSAVQLSAAAVPAAQVGQIVFGSSGQLNPNSSQGINDQIQLQLHIAARSPASTSLYAWLLPDTSNDEQVPLLLGTLHPDANGAAQLTYQTSDHQDLLAVYSRVLITEEASAPTPMTPSLDQATWKYQGAIPHNPTPGDENHFSLLDHLRHLLAKDPDLEKIGLSGGLTIWLYRNSQKVAEWSSAARDDWTNANVPALRPMVTRILDYLDGEPYAWRDLPPGTPFVVDAQAGRIGLLEIDQNETPPAYLQHITIHMTGLVNAPGATTAEKQMGVKIGNALKPITTWYQNARSDAIQLAQMTDQQLISPQALTLLNDLVVEATDAFAGQITSTQTTPGIAWIYAQLQTLAALPLTVVPPSSDQPSVAQTDG